MKKVAATKAVSKPAPAAAAASAAGAGKFVPARKSFEQVLAILKKSPPASRPAKHSRLLAHLASMIGVDADAPEADAMLYRLMASGTVSVDDKGSATYSF